MELNEFLEEINHIAESENKTFSEVISDVFSSFKKSVPGYDLFIKMQDIINLDGKNPFVYNDKPYLTTTQNQRYLSTALPENVTDAFIILGAGDTLFELVSREIPNITALEISPVQELVYQLRLASIKTLSAKDFEAFLLDSNHRNFLSSDIFDTISEALKTNEVAYHVWQTLFANNSSENLKNHLFKLVSSAGGDIGKLRYSLPYIKRKTSYYALRELLERVKIKIVVQDAFDYLLMHPEEKFDYIDISNILLFVYQTLSKNNRDDFLMKLSNLLSIYNNNLRENGTFVFDYLFGVDLSDLDSVSIKKENIKRLLANPIEIYTTTYHYLRQHFNLESWREEAIVKGICKPYDTILLTRKPANKNL